MSLLVSYEKEKLDIDITHQFLMNSHWDKGRTIEEVSSSVENFLGITSLVPNAITFTYLIDLFITEKYRSNGYSKLLTKTTFKRRKTSKM